MPAFSKSWLGTLAWVNVIAHVVALGFAATGIRPGSPLVSLDARLEYLKDAPAGWTAGWVSWMVCAVLLIAFLATLWNGLRERSHLAQLGLIIAVVGAGFDLFCNSVFVLVFPMLASWPHSTQDLFLLVERTTGIGSLAVANGGYSVAILLFTLALPDRETLGRLTRGIGYAVTGFGLLLAAAGFTGVPWHAAWATPPTIVLYCIWVILVARLVEPNGRSA
jgi:hypothetical protein